ncbi:unnamed protein product [Gadus morhua 'NCC']
MGETRFESRSRRLLFVLMSRVADACGCAQGDGDGAHALPDYRAFCREAASEEPTQGGRDRASPARVHTLWYTTRAGAWTKARGGQRREQTTERSQGVDAHLGLKGEPSCGAIPHVVYRADHLISNGHLLLFQERCEVRPKADQKHGVVNTPGGFFSLIAYATSPSVFPGARRSPEPHGDGYVSGCGKDIL